MTIIKYNPLFLILSCSHKFGSLLKQNCCLGFLLLYHFLNSVQFLKKDNRVYPDGLYRNINKNRICCCPTTLSKNVSIISSIPLILCGTIINYIIDKIGIKNISLMVTVMLLLLTNSYVLWDYEINHNKKVNLNKINFLITASFLNFNISYLLTPIIAEKYNSYYLQLLVLGMPTWFTKVTEELKRSSRLETEEHISEEKNKLQKNISSKEELLTEYQEIFKNEVQEPPLIKNERRELKQLKAELNDVSYKHQDCKSFYSQYDKIINRIIAYIYSIRENNLLN